MLTRPERLAASDAAAQTAAAIKRVCADGLSAGLSVQTAELLSAINARSAALHQAAQLAERLAEQLDEMQRACPDGEG